MGSPTTAPIVVAMVDGIGVAIFVATASADEVSCSDDDKGLVPCISTDFASPPVWARNSSSVLKLRVPALPFAQQAKLLGVVALARW